MLPTRKVRACLWFDHKPKETAVAGLCSDAIRAPLVVDRPIDGVIFLAWLEQQLSPTLAKGDVVITEDLPTHKIAGVRAIVEKAGASASPLF